MKEKKWKILLQGFRLAAYQDHSNAAMHCAKVRYSPITFRLAEVLQPFQYRGMFEDYLDYYLLTNVLSHKGQYQEDPGR